MPNGAQSPAERLASVTIKRLVEAGLIAERRTEYIKSKLLSGEAREQDWRIWVLGVDADADGEEEN